MKYARPISRDALPDIERAKARFWRKVRKSDDCWVWTAAVDGTGRGNFWISRRVGNLKAHRFAYETEVGSVPAGAVIDHLCRNPLCVNPSHLRVCTNKENILCGVSFSAVNAKKTQCPNGHAYDQIDSTGRRRCRRCRRH